jgi:hypothetical protein
MSVHRHGFGIARREFLQVGFSGALGLGLPGLLAARARSVTRARARSVIIIFQTGGPSHLDTFDLKPDAPEGIRGEFKPIATRAAGVRYGEHLPKLAARADRLAIVRTLSHEHTNHLNATHQVLTGHPQPFATFDKIASRDDYPHYASALDALDPRNDGIPSGVLLPTFLMEGPLTWPGQHAGFLGPRFDPWQIRQDPNGNDFRVDSLTLPDGFSLERLGRRRTLADDLGALGEHWGSRVARDPFAQQQESAYRVLLSGAVAAAFRIQDEAAAVRDRYGRHMYGQSLLLARRLVQAGVPIVQVNLGIVQTWDTHSGNFKSLKERLLPPTDQGVAALLDDLDSRGMLDETLVVLMGEFGRTPRIGSSTGNVNTRDGRDHWANVFSAAFAGAGVVGGQTIGRSDPIGGFPATPPYSTGDLAATIYESLGISPDVELHDRLGRPIRLFRGRSIGPLYSAAAS